MVRIHPVGIFYTGFQTSFCLPTSGRCYSFGGFFLEFDLVTEKDLLAIPSGWTNAFGGEPAMGPGLSDFKSLDVGKFYISESRPDRLSLILLNLFIYFPWHEICPDPSGKAGQDPATPARDTSGQRIRPMRSILRLGPLVALALLLANQAYALPCPPGNPPTNCAPPGGAILDLDGTPVPHTYQQYSVGFTATQASTNISFSLREDPAFLGLDDVSVTTGGGPNLLANPGFELGILGNNAPVGWTYLNSFGAGAAGVVSNNGSPGPHSGSLYYRDGAIQAYDGITQAIATTIGSTYTISFWLDDNGPLNTFSRLSTNGNETGTGGNGIDVLVYAGAIPTLATPEPTSLVLLGSALLGLGILRRRKAA